MKNSLFKKIYHAYVVKRHRIKNFRGGWLLAHVFLEDYKWVPLKKYHEVMKAHSRGWSYKYKKTLDINRKNFNKYLNNRDYYSLHPYNDVYSSWIDDKLTFKYILNGTVLTNNVPEYYFQINEQGKIYKLMDYHENPENVDSQLIFDLLKKKGRLAFKKIKAEAGIGFIKAESLENGNKFRVNGEIYEEKDIIKLIDSLRGYIVTEYLMPHPYFARFCDKSVGSLRCLVGRMFNGELKEIVTFMRLGTNQSGSIDNYNAGGVVVYLKNGKFNRGHILNLKTNEDEIIYSHPDNGLKLEGEFPNFKKVNELVKNLMDLMPQLSYVGLDICLTDKNELKIIEINSLNSLAFQIDSPLYETPAADFFKERLAAADKNQ